MFGACLNLSLSVPVHSFFLFVCSLSCFFSLLLWRINVYIYIVFVRMCNELISCCSCIVADKTDKGDRNNSFSMPRCDGASKAPARN